MDIAPRFCRLCQRPKRNKGNKVLFRGKEGGGKSGFSLFCAIREGRGGRKERFRGGGGEGGGGKKNVASYDCIQPRKRGRKTGGGGRRGKREIKHSATILGLLAIIRPQRGLDCGGRKRGGEQEDAPNSSPTLQLPRERREGKKKNAVPLFITGTSEKGGGKGGEKG